MARDPRRGFEHGDADETTPVGIAIAELRDRQRDLREELRHDVAELAREIGDVKVRQGGVSERLAALEERVGTLRTAVWGAGASIAVPLLGALGFEVWKFIKGG